MHYEPRVTTKKPVYDLLLEVFLLNPGITYKDAAVIVGHSPVWVSYIVNSDMFQAKLRERKSELFDLDIKAKLTGTAHLLTERIAERAAAGNCSERFLVDASKTVFSALGYGAAPAPQVHQHLHLSANDLAAARESAARHFAGRAEVQQALEAPLEEVEEVA